MAWFPHLRCQRADNHQASKRFMESINFQSRYKFHFLLVCKRLEFIFVKLFHQCVLLQGRKMGQCEPHKLNFGCTDGMEDNTYKRVCVSWSSTIFCMVFITLCQNILMIYCYYGIFRCRNVNPIIFCVWMGHKRAHCKWWTKLEAHLSVNQE